MPRRRSPICNPQPCRWLDIVFRLVIFPVACSYTYGRSVSLAAVPTYSGQIWIPMMALERVGLDRSPFLTGADPQAQAALVAPLGMFVNPSTGCPHGRSV